MGPRRKDNDRRSKPATAGKRPDQTSSPAASKKDVSSLPLELQQLILNQFSRAFPFGSTAALQSVIQNVKGHLYNRDFANAFGQPENLEAYAVRWSASRALGYADLLTSLQEILQDRDTTLPSDSPLPSKQVICIGGGAGAELAALSAVLGSSSHLSIVLLDIADWSRPISQLQRTLTTAPALSPYASESAKAVNKSLVPAESLSVEFVQHDVLTDWPEPLRNERLPSAELVTIMFTLNELFSASTPKTTKMLLDLSSRMRVGARLLVVDSPGSYSEVRLGRSAQQSQSQSQKEEEAVAGERLVDGEGEEQGARMAKEKDKQDGKTKQYPMRWLMDHTLMEVTKGKWEKVLEDESRWFRVAEGARYAIELENMRYQVHLYRRVGA